MFAGKTTELLRRIERARAQGLRVLPVKPMRDTRYSEGHLVTHTGVRIDARRVVSLAELVDELVAEANATRSESPGADAIGREGDRDTPRANPRVGLVAIDEIHFFASEAVAPIATLRAHGVRVVVAGCDLDHFGEVFAPFDALLPCASLVTRLTGTCVRCGGASTHSERTVAATERIIVGGAAEFVATCAACFRPSRREPATHRAPQK
jgi:thymidine kinase